MACQLAPRETLWSAHDEVIDAALRLLGATADDVLADYGCGDGRVLRRAAARVGCRCLGYEIHAPRAAEASQRVVDDGLAHLVTIHAGNALDADFSPPTCVFLFLIKRGLRVMLPYLNAAAAKKDGGLRIVTALYRFPDEVVPERREVVEVNADLRIPLFVYRFPVVLPPPTGAAAGAVPAVGAAAARDEDEGGADGE